MPGVQKPHCASRDRGPWLPAPDATRPVGQILDGDQFGAVELAEQSDAGIDRLVDQSAVTLAHDHDSAGAAIAFRAAFLGADRPLL
jgi:hypothetical protein